MFALSMLGGLSPLIFIALLYLSCRAIARAVHVPKSLPREPVCENCKYRVAGLNSFACPECGRDLRQVGIVTLPMEVRRRAALAPAIAGWIFIVLAVGAVVAGV